MLRLLLAVPVAAVWVCRHRILALVADRLVGIQGRMVVMILLVAAVVVLVVLLVLAGAVATGVEVNAGSK